jgi:hypothetical protein
MEKRAWSHKIKSRFPSWRDAKTTLYSADSHGLRTEGSEEGGGKWAPP